MEKVVLSLMSGEEAAKAGASPSVLMSGKPETVRGKLFLRVGDKIFSCPDTREGRSLLSAITDKPAGIPCNERELYRLALDSETGSLPEGTPLFGVPPVCDRCVLLFCPASGGMSVRLPEILEELAPLEDKDILIRTHAGESVLIRRTERRAPDDIIEYAAALCGTVESETGLRLRVGIGGVARSLGELGKSCREAREALTVGRKTLPGESVYAYDRLLLERFLTRIPPDILAEYRDEIFRGQTLSAELMETVDMFFRCDLNLSVTARRMYIHRNTLTYRLDKVWRMTGLDLRKTRDALAFRLLTALPEPREQGEPNE